MTGSKLLKNQNQLVGLLILGKFVEPRLQKGATGAEINMIH